LQINKFVLVIVLAAIIGMLYVLIVSNFAGAAVL